MRHKATVVAVGAVALLIGALFGPSLASATSHSFVTLVHGKHTAGISKSGQVSVNPHLTKTTAGQVTETEAKPSSFVDVFSPPTCDPNGAYKVPKGKALIITDVEYYNHPSTTNAELDLFDGPAASPCTSLIGAGVASASTTTSEPLSPGIAVPAGDALGVAESNDTGTLQVFGYLVPAADVPVKAASTSKVRHLHHATVAGSD